MGLVLGDLPRVRALIENHAETAGLQMLSQGLRFHPRKHFLRTLCRRLKQLVRRPKGVENHIPVRQKVVSIFGAHADRVGKDLQGIGFRQLGTAVEFAFGDQTGDHLFGGGRKAFAQRAHDGGRQRLGERCSRATVGGWVRLQGQARQSKPPVTAEVGKTDAARR